MLGFVQGPNIASLQYTQKILEQVHESVVKVPEIQSTAEISGAGFNGNAANQGIFFAHFKPWGDRPKANQTVAAILKKLNGQFAGTITGATAVGSSPPPIPGFSPLGGFNMQLEDTTGEDSRSRSLPETPRTFYRKPMEAASSSLPAHLLSLQQTPLSMKSTLTGIS